MGVVKITGMRLVMVKRISKIADLGNEAMLNIVKSKTSDELPELETTCF